MSGWRETAKMPRFLGLDGRIFVIWILFLTHIKLWTALVALVLTVIVGAAQYMGVPIDVLMRKVRSWFTGQQRLSRPWWRRGLLVLVCGVGASVLSAPVADPAAASFEIVPSSRHAAASPAGDAGMEIVGDRNSMPGHQAPSNHMGFGDNIPVQMAMKAIVPNGWVVVVSDSVRSKRVSWSGSTSWRDSINQIARASGLLIVLDEPARRVVVQPRFLLGGDKQFCESVREILPAAKQMRSEFRSETLKSELWKFNTCR